MATHDELFNTHVRRLCHVKGVSQAAAESILTESREMNEWLNAVITPSPTEKARIAAKVKKLEAAGEHTKAAALWHTFTLHKEAHDELADKYKAKTTPRSHPKAAHYHSTVLSHAATRYAEHLAAKAAKAQTSVSTHPSKSKRDAPTLK